MDRIYVYNTLTRKKELFKPQYKNIVNMYVCGITPYDETHLGHGRCYVVFDVIRRYLEYSNYKVNYIQNFTDIDDKIINRSKELGISPKELADKYIKSYFENSDKLNIKRAHIYPRVTENIPEIIESIKKLIDKGIAYVVDGNVYFSVKNFPNYGKLSRRNLDELITGVRIESDEKKKDSLDFALWKSVKTPNNEISWDSPWGKGRPGWHIECSVMSIKYLSETIDIHGGGQDLVFPHHENEIAQSESLTGKKFVNYWLHNGFVTINNEKMSKSLQNFFTLKDIFQKYTPNTVRYFLLTQHYRTPIDFSDNKLEQSKIALTRINNTIHNIFQFLKYNNNEQSTDIIRNLNLSNTEFETVKTCVNNFEAAMNDDFNTELAIGYLHELCSLINTELNNRTKINTDFICYAANKLIVLYEDILGIKYEYNRIKDIDEQTLKLIEQKLQEREIARKNKNWVKSDEIRKQLQDLGIIVQDTPYGQKWYKK